MNDNQPRHIQAAPFLTLMCVLGTSFASMSHAADRVFPKNGVPASGKIVSLSPAKAVIEVRGKNQEYAISDVLKITFDGEPNGIDRARDNCVKDPPQFDQALDEVKKVDAGSITNPVIKQEYEFYRWYSEGKLALAGQGDKQAAYDGLLDIAKVNRNTHHLYELSELLGQLALTVQPDRANSYFRMLLSAPDDTTKANGVYRMAQVELSAGNSKTAREGFGQLVSTNNSSAEMARVKSLAEVGLAVCDHLDGNSEDALRKLYALEKKYPATEQELFARIANARGACYQKLGKPVDALWSYLQTDLLFFTESEAHAEALYHLQSLWSEYGNPAKSADARRRLLESYASSVWANKS